MKQDKRFLRQCCICREYKKKDDLVRITRDYKTGEAKINDNNCVQGRSVYICKNKECVAAAIKKKKSLYSLKSASVENVKEILGTVLKS